MTYHPKRHHRRSIRLRGYNCARPGAYFLTLITENRANLFGEIVRGQMRLSAAGEVVWRCWHDIPKHFPHAVLDAFQVMPNHVHGVLVFSRPGRSSPRTLQAGERPRGTSMTVGSVVRGFKIGVTKWMRQHTRVHDVWHRNYWEHIVLNPAELARIRRYIINGGSASPPRDRARPARGSTSRPGDPARRCRAAPRSDIRWFGMPTRVRLAGL